MLIPAGSARGRFNGRLRHAEAQRHVQIQIAGAVPGDQTDERLRLLTIHIRTEQVRAAVQLLLAGKLHRDRCVRCKFQPIDRIDRFAGRLIIADLKCTAATRHVCCFPQLMRREQRVSIVDVQRNVIFAFLPVDSAFVHRQRKGELCLIFVPRICLAAHADGCVLDIFLGDDVGDVARSGRL